MTAMEAARDSLREAVDDLISQEIHARREARIVDELATAETVEQGVPDEKQPRLETMRIY